MADKKPKLQDVSEATKNNRTVLQAEQSDSNADYDSEEGKKLYAQRDFLARVARPAFTAAANARRKYDQEWLARNLFWRGYQFSKYIPNSQTVVLSNRQTSRLPINYVASTMRAIRNQVTSFRPKFEVLPEYAEQESSKVQARYTQRLLDFYFDKLKLKKKIKDTLTQALLYSIGGPWQIVYDEIEKDIKIWLIDPFDFYCDPLAEDYEEAEYLIKAVRRPLSEVTHNPTFNLWARREVAAGDAKIAASEYKQFMIQSLKMVSPRITDESPMVILYEGYFKRRREDGKVYMVKCIWTEQNLTPLVYEELDQDTYDFVVYRGDINPKDIYGESWMKHVMPLNRALNSLETSAFEYNYRVAKGRIVVDKDSGVRAISNVHGEIISKNRGAEVKALDMAPLPVAVPQQITRLWRYIEDITGVHEASLGRVPTGVKSGVGVAELKQADATSQDDLVDNLEDFMADVAHKMLRKISENVDSYKVIRDLGVRDGNEKYFAVVGKRFAKSKKSENRPSGKERMVKIGPDWLDLVEIGENNTIRVGVGSWLGYTKEALQQKVISFYQMGLIDQSTALKLLEFGDIESIVHQSRIEALLKKQGGSQPGQQGQPDNMSLAMAENDMLLEGKEAPVSENDDHLVHIAIHQDALGRGMDDVVGAHIEKHQVYMGNQPTVSESPAAVTPEAQTPSGNLPENQGPIGAMQNQQPITFGGGGFIPAGSAPGTNLPQQNIVDSLTKANAQAQQMAPNQ